MVPPRPRRRRLERLLGGTAGNHGLLKGAHGREDRGGGPLFRSRLWPPLAAPWPIPGRFKRAHGLPEGPVGQRSGFSLDH